MNTMQRLMGSLVSGLGVLVFLTTPAAADQPVSFRHDVIAALNVGGCNQGACHGTPSGKGGFKLSLRGYDPDADYLQLTRDVFGRRTARLDPDASLIVQKALGRIPHEGGQRFQPDSVPFQALRSWLAQGMPDDPSNLPAVARLEVLPGSRVLRTPEKALSLTVRAHFTDGRIRDVTPLTVFSSSENAVAEPNPTGLVQFKRVGEVAILCRYLDTMQAVRLTYLEPRPNFVWPNPPEHNYVDKHVFAKLKLLNLPPSDLCTDHEFLRRASLDLLAVLPTPDEVKAFVADTDKNKRAELIDRLLAQPEYADFWTLKWMDVLRASRRTLGAKGLVAYRTWLHGHLAQNTPFDQIVRALLTSQGNTAMNGPANYYSAVRDPQELAETTAQVFLGVRMQCAKCHNHPFERWSQDDYFNLSSFFARVKQKGGGGNKNKPADTEVLVETRGELTHPRTRKPVTPRFLGGAAATLDKDQDRREPLATWLVAPENPFFARALVNRVWYHLFGKGIVEPADDFRDSNPPAHDELLDALASDFVARNFDMKPVIRTIMTSRTYQLSARTNEYNKEDTRYFSHALTRLLTAEQMLDALSFVTEVHEKFPGVPAGTRAVQLPDSDGTHPLMKTFGQPARELPCECEREGESNLGQAMQLINGGTVHQKLTERKNRIGRLLEQKTPDAELLTELYLVTLSRPPREPETKAALEYVAKASDKRQAWEDVQWALLNSKEFMFRH